MKKYLPFILLVLGIVVVVVVLVFLKGKKDIPPEETETVPEVAFDLRPVASLTPSEDGHWLKLKIQKIQIEAATVDYELLYRLPDGRTQGVPGTVNLEGKTELERDLLLGSESSGKFRYDEGVKEGSLTLRFRNEKGKLAAKFSTDFILLSEALLLTSADGKFTATLSGKATAFFVVMQTFGVTDNPPSEVLSGPYGLFSSDTGKIPALVKMESYKAYRHITGSRWAIHQDNDNINDSDTHIFVGTN